MRIGPKLLAGVLTMTWTLACGGDRTYYPIWVCQGHELCKSVCIEGHMHQRSQIAFEPVSFTALPEQQDVIKKDYAIVSFSKDRHLKCRVLDRRNWQCIGDDVTPETQPLPEMWTMENGALTTSEGWPSNGRPYTMYTSWCHWQQVKWHNYVSHQDDVGPYPTMGSRLPWLGVLLYAITGCVI